jgi:outer membrane protein assembly factor BamB
MIGAAVVVLLVVGAAAAYWVVNRRTADVHNGDKLPFTLTSDPTTTQPSSTHTTKRERILGPSWPVYGLSDARTRDASAYTNLHPPYHVQWSAPVGFMEYPPVYAKGVLYMYANGGYVSARNVFTGKLLWSRSLLPKNSQLLGQGSPAVHAGIVYLGARNGHIYALSAKTGRTIWNTYVGATMESSPAFDSRFLYMADQDGVVRALYLGNGHVAWSFHAGAEVKHGPAVVGGKVYFGDYGGAMYCLRASDGHEIWRTGTAGLASGFSSGTFFSTPAVAYGRVYIGNTDHKVYSFVAATGQLAWTYTMPDWAYGSPAVSNGRVFVTSFNGTFAALNARTGSVLWSHTLPTKTLASPVVIGKYVYVADLGPGGGAKGRVLAYNPTNGHRAWQFIDGKYATPIAAAGRLVVTGATHVYVLRPLK